MKITNLLKNEKSPYLLQHKDNPVYWQAWNQQAFDLAKSQNKPIFLSIGYSTCHWCHVMEHDSFEKKEVADILNEHFISIKVDREEMPEVDHIYMNAVVAMRGQGGWPLSVFLTPDLKPFFGGTFFWKDQFSALLLKISDVWEKSPNDIFKDSQQIVDHLQNTSQVLGDSELTKEVFDKAIAIFKESFDSTHGGFGSAPKFPRSFDLSLLLRIKRHSGDASLLNMVETTLNKMARGGIYDHLGGGFARYSTDEKWMVPHFEKMLYDNALLSLTYLEAYQITKNEMYKDVASQILDYVLNDMTHSQGGFYSAEDADSEGVEGKFYVWQFSELEKILNQDELTLIQKIYGVTKNGNFEDQTNILYLTDDYDWSIKKDSAVHKIHQKLLNVRKKRIHPLKDDKILTEWNGLMIAAMSKAFHILKEKKYLDAAIAAVEFIKKNLWQNNQLLRRFREGEARFEAKLNDYSFLIFGLCNLYEASLDENYLEWAVILQQIQNKNFLEDNIYQMVSKNSQKLFITPKEFNDGAIPSGNSVSAYNLLKLYDATFHQPYLEMAKNIFKKLSTRVNYYPLAYAMLLIAFDYHLDVDCQGDFCVRPTIKDKSRIQKIFSNSI